MLPGKRDFYRCCKARRSASHVNKEFWQQFQNYAPPSLRVIRTKFTCTIIYIYNNIYIHDSRLNRPESVHIAGFFGGGGRGRGKTFCGEVENHGIQ